MYLNANTGRGGVRVAKCQNGTLKEELANKLKVGERTIMRDAKFAQSVNLLKEYRNEILMGITEHK